MARSEFVTMREAADMLGKTERSVRTYLKAGLLRREKRDGLVFIPYEDVQNLVVQMGAQFPPMNKETFFRLVAQVTQLQHDIEVLKRAQGIISGPLRPSRQEAVALYHAARAMRERTEWTEVDVRQWAEIFDRLDELAFDAIAESVDERPSWAPFYHLCLHLMKMLEGQHDFSTNLALRRLHEQLSVGLKRIRGIILVWVELHGETAVETLSEMDGPVESVLRRVAKAQ